MSSEHVRVATLDDAPGIAAVQVLTWQHAYRNQIPDSYLDSLSIETRTEKWKTNLTDGDEGKHPLVYVEDGKVLGWCTLGKNRDGDLPESVGELWGIYVLPDQQGKGIGKALMNSGLDLLRKDGYSSATLWVLTSNAPSRAFYESQGWRVEGKTKIDPRDGFELHETRYIIDLK